jgi:FAD-dependent oxidoreductase domain-containing protein 1
MVFSIANCCRRHRQLALETILFRSLSSTSTKDYDIVIVGGGVIGASVAYHTALLDSSLRICVVEKDPTYTHASAMLSAGGIRQQFSLPANIQLSLYGIDFLRKIPKALKVADSAEEPPDLQFREQGYLFLASPGTGESTLRRNVATQREFGVDWTVLLGPEELKSRFPWLKIGSDDSANSNQLSGHGNIALGSLGEHSEGWFDPWALLTALRTKTKSMGVDFVHGEVTDLRLDPSSLSLPTVKSVAVRYPRDGSSREFGAGTVVNAAGAFASDIVNMCNREENLTSLSSKVIDLPVRARRRCIFSFHCDEASNGGALVPSATTTPLTVCPETGVYFRPDGTGAGRFLCGVSPPANSTEFPDRDVLGDEVIGGALEVTQTDHALFEEVIWPSLFARCEAFGALKVTGSWVGLYEYNILDQNAVVGFHPTVQNLLLCNGFSGHGLQQAPGAGRAVSELLVHGKFTTLDLSCFGFDRVLRNEPIFEENIV